MQLACHARRTLAALLTAAVALGAIAATPALATARGDGLRAAANAARQDEREGPMAPVTGTNLLDAIADRRADQMRDADRLDHDMAYVKHRLEKAGVCWTRVGEIVAWRSPGTYSYEYTIDQWLNSDTHRAILLDDGYHVAGGSWATAADGGHYSVMVFVRLCSRESSEPSTLQPKRTYVPSRAMRLVKGEHRAFRFNANGRVVDTRTVTFGRHRGENATGRARVDGSAFLKVASGELAGWWVRESPRQYARGMTQKRAYASARLVRVARGSYTAVTFDRLGRVTDSAKASFGRARRFETTARAFINGRAWFKVTSGPLAGHWLRDNRDVRLAR